MTLHTYILTKYRDAPSHSIKINYLKEFQPYTTMHSYQYETSNMSKLLYYTSYYIWNQYRNKNVHPYVIEHESSILVNLEILGNEANNIKEFFESRTDIMEHIHITELSKMNNILNEIKKMMNIDCDMYMYISDVILDLHFMRKYSFMKDTILYGIHTPNSNEMECLLKHLELLNNVANLYNLDTNANNNIHTKLFNEFGSKKNVCQKKKYFKQEHEVSDGPEPYNQHNHSEFSYILDDVKEDNYHSNSVYLCYNNITKHVCMIEQDVYFTFIQYPFLLNVYDVEILEISEEEQCYHMCNDELCSTNFDSFKCLIEELIEYSNKDYIDDNVITTYIRSNYSIVHDKAYKIQFSELQERITKGLEKNGYILNDDAKSMIRYNLPKILKSLELNKFRASEGIYWYGLKEKESNVMISFNPNSPREKLIERRMWD